MVTRLNCIVHASRLGIQDHRFGRTKNLPVHAQNYRNEQAKRGVWSRWSQPRSPRFAGVRGLHNCSRIEEQDVASGDRKRSHESERLVVLRMYIRMPSQEHIHIVLIHHLFSHDIFEIRDGTDVRQICSHGRRRSRAPSTLGSGFLVKPSGLCCLAGNLQTGEPQGIL